MMKYRLQKPRLKIRSVWYASSFFNPETYYAVAEKNIEYFSKIFSKNLSLLHNAEGSMIRPGQIRLLSRLAAAWRSVSWNPGSEICPDFRILSD